MTDTKRQRAGLWIEWGALFVAIPVMIAVAFPSAWMFPALFGATVLGLGLLAITPGFFWSSLMRGAMSVNWRMVLVTGVVTALVGIGILWLWTPHALFSLLGPDAPRSSGGWPIILLIALFYPIVSALPQELVFRVLFFRRYGHLLPQGGAGLVLNAGVFSVAHLMYWSGVVTVLTFAGGLVFAWSYERQGNFAQAVVLHSEAGVVLFTVGMGAYFYSGNVVRPF